MVFSSKERENLLDPVATDQKNQHLTGRFPDTLRIGSSAGGPGRSRRKTLTVTDGKSTSPPQTVCGEHKRVVCILLCQRICSLQGSVWRKQQDNEERKGVSHLLAFTVFISSLLPYSTASCSMGIAASSALLLLPLRSPLLE